MFYCLQKVKSKTEAENHCELACQAVSWHGFRSLNSCYSIPKGQ